MKIAIIVAACVALAGSAFADVVVKSVGNSKDKAWVEYRAIDVGGRLLRVEYRLRCQRKGDGEAIARAKITFYVFDKKDNLVEARVLDDYCSARGDILLPGEAKKSGNGYQVTDFPGFAVTDIGTIENRQARIVVGAVIDKNSKSGWEASGISEKVQKELDAALKSVLRK